jgi:hypothetical protein
MRGLVQVLEVKLGQIPPYDNGPFVEVDVRMILDDQSDWVVEGGQRCPRLMFGKYGRSWLRSPTSGSAINGECMSWMKEELSSGHEKY